MTTTLRSPADLRADFGDSGRRPQAPARLAHLVFKTPRHDEMVDWYCTVLDAVVVFRNERLAFLTYDEEHHRIALVRLPSLFRVPGLLWSKHRKFWGLDHAAFTYDSLPDLVHTYDRLHAARIDPVWCINHGPTTSMYYEDPDGNRLELQADNFDTPDELVEWMQGGEFADNPIGVEFDPAVLAQHIADGSPLTELKRRGAAPPPSGTARAGMRTIRWKTL